MKEDKDDHLFVPIAASWLTSESYEDDISMTSMIHFYKLVSACKYSVSFYSIPSTHTHTHIQTRTHARTRTHTHSRTHIYIIYMYICTCIYTYILYAYIYMYIYNR